MSSGDDDGDLPAWITNYTSPLKRKAGGRVIHISDSGSDSGDGPFTEAAAAPLPGISSEYECGTPSQDQSKAAISTHDAAARLASAPVPVTEKALSPQPAPGFHQNVQGSGSAAGPIAKALERTLQTDADPGPSSNLEGAATAAGTASKPAIQPLVVSVAGEVPVMLSDKLSINKAIAELESLEGGHTDLTGDSGAVGRVLVAKDEEGNHRMQFDLKGMMYDAKHAPLRGTLMVVNIGQEDACVQSVFDTFLQLNRTSAFAEDDDNQKLFMDEDEDNYQYDPAYAVKAAEGGDGKMAPGKKKKEAKARPKSRVLGGGVKKKTAAKRKPAGNKK